MLSSVPLHAVLTDQRASLMDEITRRVNAKTKELGVEVGRRAHQACRSAAGQLAIGFQPHEDRPRARGRPAARRGRRGKGQRITATADREVAVIKADAGLKAQVTMGEADAEATKIYADAFNRDKDFYAF